MIPPRPACPAPSSKKGKNEDEIVNQPVSSSRLGIFADQTTHLPSSSSITSNYAYEIILPDRIKSSCPTRCLRHARPDRASVNDYRETKKASHMG